MTYSEQLKDPRWQKKRMEVLSRDKFTCRECGNTKKTLHVHHRYYCSHRMPWEYPDFCFVTLCSKCHETIKKNIEEIREHVELGSNESFYEDWELALNFIGDNCIEASELYEQSISKRAVAST